MVQSLLSMAFRKDPDARPQIESVSPPAAIPVKLNYQYFSLSQSGGPWETIVRARNLAAYVPGDFPNPQMELLILLPQAS